MMPIGRVWLAKYLVCAALFAVPAGAFAQTVTLQCGPAGQNGSLTIDVDYNRQTVFIANGNPPRSINAAIESRFITFDSPYIRARHRSDRVSGGMTTLIDGNWYPGGSCEKIGAADKPKF
jgi:hypothetical protein